jgi:hypothetical protein
MALLLSRSVFLHVPKTGGTWTAAALEQSGLVIGRLGAVHASPDEIEHQPAYQQRPMRFAMVRHPATWYGSAWAHRMDEKWGPINAPDWMSPAWTARWNEWTQRCNARLFPRFIENCTRAFPAGWLSALYDAYTQGCTHIARQETAVDDLIGILRSSGEPLDEDAIRSTPPKNVRSSSPRSTKYVVYTAEILEMIAANEKRIYSRFGYALEPAAVATPLAPPSAP